MNRGCMQVERARERGEGSVREEGEMDLVMRSLEFLS